MAHFKQNLENLELSYSFLEFPVPLCSKGFIVLYTHTLNINQVRMHKITRIISEGMGKTCVLLCSRWISKPHHSRPMYWIKWNS